MARLNESDYASLLEEISHALRYDYPLPETLDRLSHRRLGSIGKSAKQIADRVRSGQTIAQAFEIIQSPLTAPVQAALAGAERATIPSSDDENQNGSSDAGVGHRPVAASNHVPWTSQSGAASPSGAVSQNAANPYNHWRLLQRMASMIRNRQDAKRVFRLAFLYPCLLVLLGYASIALIASSLIQDGMELGVFWPRLIREAAQSIDENPWPPLMILIGLMFLVHLLVGRTRWFSRQSSYGLFCYALADQCEAGMNDSEAIANASKIANLALPATTDLLINHPIVQRIVRPKNLRSGRSSNAENDHATPKFSVDDLDESTQSQILIGELRLQARTYFDNARIQRVIWSNLVPRILAILIGSSLCIGYVFFVIRPIYETMGGS